jgi:hypothetical protein
MDENTNIARNTILEPLRLNPTATTSVEENILLTCIFCDHFEKDDFRTENKIILHHMYMEHRLVISDVHEVMDLKEYLKFWKNEFKG